MPTSVGDSGDSSAGIADMWVGDANDSSVRPQHAWVGDANDDPVQFDMPTQIEGEDTSQCFGSGDFQSPEFSAQISWANMHFGNVDAVEIERNSVSDFDEVAVGDSGLRQTYSDSDPPISGSGPWDVEYCVRYRFTDGTFSEWICVTVTIQDPC